MLLGLQLVDQELSVGLDNVGSDPTLPLPFELLLLVLACAQVGQATAAALGRWLLLLFGAGFMGLNHGCHAGATRRFRRLLARLHSQLQLALE